MHAGTYTRRALFGALLAATLVPMAAQARGGGKGGGRGGGGSRGRGGYAGSGAGGRGSANADDDCACGTGNICTGPRGGRYCTTGSGNKRYLKK